MGADFNHTGGGPDLGDTESPQLAKEAFGQLSRIDSERQFGVLVNGVRDYAIYMLNLSGIVSSWNAGAEKIKGYKAEEIIGQHFSKFYLPADRAAGLPERSLAIALEQGRFEAEAQRMRKDGSIFWAT